MSWGDGTPWGSGSFWGSGGAFANTMLQRLLMFVQRGPHFVAIVNALATRTENLLAAANTIAQAFDLDTAVGAQLDRLGEILQRPRYGMDDDRYRVMLAIQIDLILSSTASAETLLSVVERLTGSPAPEYQEFYPAQFQIGAIVDPDDVVLLVDLLRKAKGWGIYGGLVVYPDGATETEGTLLGDLIDEGLWTTVVSDRTCALNVETLDEPISNQTAVADGTTTVPAFDARNFDGATNRVDLITSPDDLSLPQPFTVSAWVRWETLGGLRIIWTAQQVTGPSQCMILRSNGSSLDFAHAYSAGTSLQRMSTATLVTAAWTHVAVTFPGTATASDVHLYINGVETAYATTTNGSGTPRTAGGPWSIGGRIESDTNCIDADIAVLDAWPRVLGPEEIWHLYEEGIASGAFDGTPDPTPSVDNPGVGDLATPTYALAYPTATLVPV